MVICVNTVLYHKYPDIQMIIGTLNVCGAVVMLLLVDEIVACCKKRRPDTILCLSYNHVFEQVKRDKSLENMTNMGCFEEGVVNRKQFKKCLRYFGAEF
jgi:hypothetical protein